jgi:CelD/BcsL family acetyltransferase involved in cellulose biosynthesis
MHQMTRNLAVEWAEDGIRVNSVAPWYIRTRRTSGKLADPDYLDDEPGRILLLRLLRKALREGYLALDLLRGDEPYKSHLGAERKYTQTVLIGNRTLVGKTAFGLALLRRKTRKLAGQVLRQLRAP